MLDGSIMIKDLAFFILFCTGTAALVYLIIALRSLNNLLKHSHKILETNEEFINETMLLLPEAVKTVNETATAAKEGIEKADSTITTMGGAVSETIAVASENADHIITYAKIAKEVVQIVIDMFNKYRQKD